MRFDYQSNRAAFISLFGISQQRTSITFFAEIYSNELSCEMYRVHTAMCCNVWIIASGSYASNCICKLPPRLSTIDTRGKAVTLAPFFITSLNNRKASNLYYLYSFSNRKWRQCVIIHAVRCKCTHFYINSNAWPFLYTTRTYSAIHTSHRT